MASQQVTLVGVAYTDKTGNPPTPVTIVAEMYLTGLGVGGGPIYPPSGGGGQPGVPTFPIWGPPGSNFPGGPGYPPVAGWPGGGPGGAHPDNSLPIPQPPIDVPPGEGDDNGFVKPPVEGQSSWSYHEVYGWGYYPSGASAGPKK